MRGADQVETRTREFREACAFRVTVGTNGYHGGDSGHGSRTYLRLDSDGADIKVTRHPDGHGVTIELGGDAELSTFTQALDYSADTLKEMAGAGRR